MPEQYPVVVIEGTLTPSSELPRGQRATVALDPGVRRRVKRGFVRIVEFKTKPEAAEVVDEQSETVDPDAPPKGNADRDTWAAFLTKRGIPFPDGGENPETGEEYPVAGRDELRTIWQQVSGGS